MIKLLSLRVLELNIGDSLVGSETETIKKIEKCDKCSYFIPLVVPISQ
jgi:hypothetical protein